MRFWKRPRKPAASEFDQELQFHIDQLAQEKIRQGIPPAQALREAKLDFGGTENFKEELRDVHRIPVLDSMGTRLRYALRSLRATPTFSLAVIITLTLGIGANTAVFSAIDAVLLRPLPYPDSDRLFVLKEYRVKTKNPEGFVAPVRLEDWNRLNTTFQAISGYYTEDSTDSASGYYAEDAKDDAGTPPVKIKRAFVAPRFLQTMGISPTLGHDFTSSDERFTGYAPPTVLISDHFWRTHFHSDPDVIGKRLLRGKTSATVIGVLPSGFHFPSDEVELWYLVPPTAPYAQNRRSTWYTAIGRLKSGVTQSQAHANLNLVQSQLAKQFPDTDTDVTAKLTALKEMTVGSSGASLWLLFGAVSVLLLIACTNVSALVLARGMEREREFSVRSSLGASRSTLMAQVLTETLLLAVSGMLVGLVIAASSARVLATLAKSIPRIGEVALDWRIFSYTAGCAIIVTLLSGLFPAFRASLTSPAGALSRGGRTQVSGGHGPAQWILVGIQVALAVCLLSGAALLLRSFEALSTVAPGFDASHVLAFRLTGTYAETADGAKLKQTVNRDLEALRVLPGVQAAAGSLTLPGVPFKFPLELSSPDSAFDPASKITAESRYVTDGYFTTMKIPIVSGASCDQHSDGNAMVVNQSFVSAYYGGASNPIGHHLAVTPNPYNSPASTVLGVAADAREAGVDSEPVPTVYWCGVVYDPNRVYLVRTAGSPSDLMNAVRQTMYKVEPSRAVYDLSPLLAHLSDAFAEVRLRTLLLTLFAATALSLACIGLYGTMSYFVATRKREIGVRIALGASRAQVARRLVQQGVAITSLGIVAGLGIATWSAQFISGLLYNVKPTDIAALSSATMAMFSTALLASALPAIRAARHDPMEIIREE